jgi:hypothetical protein
MKPAFESALTQSHMTTGRAKIAVQMLAAFPLTYDILAQSNMTPALAAQKLRDHAKANATDTAYKTDVALGDYADLIEAIATPITVPADQSAANHAVLLKRTDEILTLTQISANEKDDHDKRFRDAEARLTMHRHQLETVMEDIRTDHSELVGFLTFVSSENLTIADARRILEDRQND